MKSNTIQNQSQIIMDFGERRVNSQNFSKTVVLPKTALQNCGCDLDDRNLKVNVFLVQIGNEKFIQLVPVEKRGEM